MYACFQFKETVDRSLKYIKVRSAELALVPWWHLALLATPHTSVDSSDYIFNMVQMMRLVI